MPQAFEQLPIKSVCILSSKQWRVREVAQLEVLYNESKLLTSLINVCK